MKLFGVLLLFAGSLSAQTERAVLNVPFDKPLSKSVIDFGPSSYYRPTQHVGKTLTCFYYSSFTVKEYDEGQKGAEWLSIVPSAHSACTRTHRKDEKVFVGPDEWHGYFWGAKDGLVFFVAPDGQDGGLPFAVFNARTGRKLFGDSSLSDYYQKKLHIESAFRIANGTGQIAQLTYFRVVTADCNLQAQPADCWKKARAEFGIRQTDIPACSGYERADWQSAIVYPVSVLITDSPQIKAVDGPVFCWPTD